MLMSKIVLNVADLLSVVFSIYLFFSYFDIFFERQLHKARTVGGLAGFSIWQLAILYINIFPVYINISITIVVVLIAVLAIYKGQFWNKIFFVITFNAIWMLVENLCRFILLFVSEEYASNQLLGSILSKVLMILVIKALKKVFTDDEIKNLPPSYNIMLVLIPIGSIYIMNNIFMIGFKVKGDRINFSSALAVIILLGINILIFRIYIKLAEDMQLKRITSAYEQQLELCERHQQEREISMLQLRDARHNMKNNLVSILAFAEHGECENIIKFVNEVIESSGISKSVIANSGNIVVDSLIGYWYLTAQKHGIEFLANISIPMNIPFKGADLSLILGNLLENAVEAAQKADGKKYIKLQMKYDKKNLLVSIANNYKGNLIKTKGKQLKSTKSDAENHGIGLQSVNRVVTKYQGNVFIDDSIPERFLIRVVLYGRQD